jgi:hypothetical protein
MQLEQYTGNGIAAKILYLLRLVNPINRDIGSEL